MPTVKTEQGIFRITSANLPWLTKMNMLNSIGLDIFPCRCDVDEQGAIVVLNDPIHESCTLDEVIAAYVAHPHLA